ncbi:Panacea domain-containing protein [Xanthomonas sp. WHRI 7945]|nr:type II toxin-antitoxin system antitoxin SocA domain-containing protein [Xanthomonas campestris pv. campestris]
MAYSPSTVANYFLEKASQEGRALTPMQLIKLVYIAHGWHLGYMGQPLINEQVQAWKYGPVIKSLYDRVRQFGSGAVQGLLSFSPFPWQVETKVDATAANLLDSVWKSYAGFSGVQLSAMTHMDNTPWSIAWHQQGGRNMNFAPIDNALIKEHYQAKIREMQAQAANAASVA